MNEEELESKHGIIVIKEEKEIEKIQHDILNMAKLCKDTIVIKKDCTEKEKNIKIELRILFLDLPEDIRKEKLSDDLVEEVSIRFPKSFKLALLKEDYPELYKKYVTIEKVIIESEQLNFNEKDLKKFHPDEYEKCFVKGTPQIRIK